MSFRVRPARLDDLTELFELARQFDLLNLPADKKRLLTKLQVSEDSFQGLLPKEQAEYLFILEDLEEQRVIGSSLIMAKHGTEEVPHNAFEVYRRNHFSEDLGLGFIHQVLKLKVDTDGPTEIGGLLLDRNYRSRPEKLGKLISFARFLYMAEYPDRFEPHVLVEFTPPLTEDGRSEFWEAIGRRFTGLPYQEADLLSQTHKEFISSLFPMGEIYLCLLDTKARSVLGRVAKATEPAVHLLESVGFEYIHEVDPFDGGPHYECERDRISVIQQSRKLPVLPGTSKNWQGPYLVAYAEEGSFSCISTVAELREEGILLPERSLALLEVSEGTQVRVAPWRYQRREHV
jgi:arginine N-succinyltransferase